MLGMEKGDRHTLSNHLTELFPNSKQQHLHPKLSTHALAHTKRPGSTFHVARILPHRADTTLEEVDRVFHLQALEWELIEEFPERLDGDDVLEHGRQAVLVWVSGSHGGGVGSREVLLMVKGPGVAEWWGADLAEHVEAHCVAVGWGGGGG